MINKRITWFLYLNFQLIFYSLNAQIPNKWIMAGYPQLNFLEIAPNFGISIFTPIDYIWFQQTNTGIADSTGDLLFYTHGFTIMNKNHEKIMNIDTLAPSPLMGLDLIYGNRQWQMAVFIPDPGDTNEFYLFYAGQDYYYQPPIITGGNMPDKFYFAKVNKSINGMNGYATTINNIILNDSIGCGILAVKHGNGRDWWIVVRHNTKGEFIRFLVDPAGVHGPWYQNIGPINYAGFVSFKFAPATNKLGCSNTWHTTKFQQCDIYDFDRCTGLASNPVSLTFTDSSYHWYVTNGGCEFSPNGRYLYVSTMMKLRQFDVLATNIAATEKIVDSVYLNVLIKGVSSRLQLGPDNKIYIDKLVQASQHLSVIHNPDTVFPYCNYTDSSITFPSPIYGSMPHFPNYNVGAWQGSPCDTLTANVLDKVRDKASLYAVWQTQNGHLLVNAYGLKSAHVTLTIYDAGGRQVYLTKNIKTENGSFSMQVNDEAENTSAWTGGLYIVRVVGERDALGVKFVKE